MGLGPLPKPTRGHGVTAFLDRHGRVVVALLGAIVLLGFALRANRALNPVKDEGVDAKAYFQLSKSLYEDHRYGTERMNNPNDWSPGAPLLYAGVYYVTGGVHDGAARMLVALLGAASIVVVYFLARRLASVPRRRTPARAPPEGGERDSIVAAAGLLAALGVAVYPPFIHDTGRLLSEPPALLTLPAALLAFLWAADHNTRGAWVWAPAGLLFGLTALLRPEYLVLGAAFVVFALVLEARPRGWSAGLASAGVLLAAFVLPILPWTIRNVVVLDRVVPISTGGGKALFVGTFLPGDGDYFRTKQVLAERYLHRQVSREDLGKIDPVPLFDRVAARYPGLSRDAALGKAGRKNLEDALSDDPLSYGGMLARKVWRMWRIGWVSMSGPVGFVWQRGLELFALVALVLLALRRRWEWFVSALPLGLITAVAAVTLAAPRRNETLMPLVIALAACGAVWLYELARDRP
jgi:4-amino-4-deoxy-L-arabinose transferase-like glycosyltransferase